MGLISILATAHYTPRSPSTGARRRGRDRVCTSPGIAYDRQACRGPAGPRRELLPFFRRHHALTGAESLRNPLNRYIFNIRASYYDETDKLVGQLVGQTLDRIAVFYQNDD